MTMGALTSPRRTSSLKRQPGLVALAVAEPADAGGQALEGDALAGRARASGSMRFVVGEQLQDGLVGAVDVLGVAGEGDPAERALPSQNSGRM